MFLEFLTAYLLRAFVAFMLAAILGMLGLVVSWMAWPPDSGAGSLLAFRLVGIGVGAGMGGLGGWLKPDWPMPLVLLTLVLAVAGGMVGTFLGMEYGSAASAQVPHPYQAAQSSTLSTVVGAALGAMLLPSLLHTYLAWRRREL